MPSRSVLLAGLELRLPADVDLVVTVKKEHFSICGHVAFIPIAVGECA
jgi:hypothetical protein